MASDWETAIIASQERAVKLAAQYPASSEFQALLDTLGEGISSLDTETFQLALLKWKGLELQLEHFLQDLEYVERVNGWPPTVANTYLGYALCALREGRLTAALQWLQKGKGAL